MTDLNILGQKVPLVIDDSLKDKAKTEKGVAVATAMAKVITEAGGKLEPREIAAFKGIKQLVLFETRKFEGRKLSRSYMDQKHATFCFEIDEFLDPGQTPERLATYYFHDAWHLVQYLAAGKKTASGEKEVDREVDATQRQVTVGKHLGADAPLLDWLQAYADDRARIRARIGAGLS